VTVIVNPPAEEVFTFPIFLGPLEVTVDTETGPFEWTFPSLLDERTTDTISITISKLDSFITFDEESRTLQFDKTKIEPSDKSYSVEVKNVTSMTYTLKVKYVLPIEEVFTPVIEITIVEEEEIIDIVEEKPEPVQQTIEPIIVKAKI
jgi:hypothetical protein